MIKRFFRPILGVSLAIFAMAGTSAKADFTFTSTLMSNNIPGVLTLTGISETTPVDPFPFGSDVGFATYEGLASSDDLSTLDATFEITFKDETSGETETFQVTATGPVGQNATSVSFFGGPTFMPSVFSFTLGATTYTLDNFRSAATPGSPKTGTFAFTVNATVVPEPASMAMLAMGGLGVLGAARRRRKV